MLTTIARGADRGPYQTQLAEECDSLMQLAVRRPYGWGWDSVALAVPAGRATPRHVSMKPHDTPASGLLLLWAGQLLDDPKYTQAAHESARGIASAQLQPGNVPLHVIFGPAAGGRDEPSVVPERTATNAGLAMVLAVIESEEPKPEELTRFALRAGLWLVKQQSPDGGWPAAYESDGNSLRMIQLNTSDYRDSTYTMLLASSMMDNRAMSTATEKAVAKLLSMRLAQQSIPAPRRAPGDAPLLPAEASMRVPLWSSGYSLAGDIDPQFEGFPPGIDVPASRYAIQTLIGAYLVTGDKSAGPAMDAAVESIKQLSGADGQWKKRYLAYPTSAPAPGFFDPRVIESTSTFGMPSTIRSVEQLKTVGRDRYEVMLREAFTVRQHLAATICGLTDDPFTLEFPVSKAEIDPYIHSHESDWAILEGPIPQDMHTRIQRLYTLLIRAKLEQRMGS